MQSKKENFLWIGTLVFLACYFLKFMNIHNLLVVAIGAMLCGLWVLEQKKIRIDVLTCLLFVSMVVYFFNYLGTRMFTSHYLYEIMILYVLAHYMAKGIQEDNNIEKKLRLVLSVVVISITLRAILNSYMFLTKQWDPYYGFRCWKDFWTGNYRLATLHVNYYLPAISSLFPALVFWKDRKVFNSSIVVACTFLMWVSVASQSRMPVLFLPIVFICQLVIYGLLDPEMIKKFLTPKRICIIVIILLIGIASIICCVCFTETGKAFMGIMGRSGGILNNERFVAQRTALRQLLVYPFGGNKMDHCGLAHTHNLWLDMADWGGLLAFVPFLCYTLITALELIQISNQAEIDLDLKLLMIGMYLSYLLFFMVEPGLCEQMDIITQWLFLHGLVHGLVKKSNKFL